MSLNEDLLDMVAAIAMESAATIFDASFALKDKITAIMYEWAGATDIDPNSRGAYIDARMVAFIEAFTGEPFRQGGTDPNPRQQASAFLKEAFGNAFNNIYAHILVQTAANEIFSETAKYILFTGKFEGDWTLDLAAIEALVEDAALTGDGLKTQWVDILRIAEFTVGLGNLSTGERAALNTLIQDSDPANYLNLSRVESAFNTNVYASNIIYGDQGINVLNGAEGNDTIYGYGNSDLLKGGGGDDRLYGGTGDDTLEGGAGHDILYGESGNDILIGGEGDDTIYGGDGKDTYIHTSGFDTLIEQGGLDKISFGPSYALADMTLARSVYAPNDLEIYFNSVLTISIQNFFNPNQAIETLQFADGSTFDLGVLSLGIEGASGNDTLNGIDYSVMPNDILYGHAGNDTLNGGLGDDRLEGGTGNDTYIISSGADTVYDTGGTADTIQFGATGYDPADIKYVVDAIYHLNILFDGTLKARIQNQFSSGNSIETLVFDDNSTVTLANVQFEQHGTAGADRIYGIRYGGLQDNLLYGGAGNDTMVNPHFRVHPLSYNPAAAVA